MAKTQQFTTLVVVMVLLSASFIIISIHPTKPVPKQSILQEISNPLITPLPIKMKVPLGWKTISEKSSQFNFAFGYPPDWEDASGHCVGIPVRKIEGLPSNCVQTMIFTEMIPNEDTFEMARDVVLTSEKTITLNGYNTKQKIYTPGSRRLINGRGVVVPEPGVMPDTYEYWIYDKSKKPIFLWTATIGSGSNSKIATDFIQDIQGIIDSFILY